MRTIIAARRERGSGSTIIEKIKKACEGRISPKLCDKFGQIALMQILADHQIRTGGPSDEALKAVLQILEKRVGSKARKWLNSWDLIRKALMNAPAESDVVDERRTNAILKAVCANDPDGMLAAYLKTPRAIQPLLTLLDTYGEHTLEVVLRTTRDGGAPGKIKSWGYFGKNSKEPLGDCALEREMFRMNSNEGTLSGSWRDGQVPDFDEVGEAPAAPVSSPRPAPAPTHASAQPAPKPKQTPDYYGHWRLLREEEKLERDTKRAAKYGFNEPMTYKEELQYKKFQKKQIPFKFDMAS